MKSERTVDRSALSSISAVSRAMAIIEELAGTREGLTAGEMSERTGSSLSMTSRILTTLLQGGYVVHDPRVGLYQLAVRTLSLAYRYADTIGFPEMVMPALRRLADETGELAQLAVVEGDDMWFIAKAEGFHRVKVVSLVGQRVILHAMAAGRVWLAHLPEETVLPLVMREGFRAYTSRTITWLEQLREELAKTRERGYGLNLGEVYEDACGIACPVFQGTGERKRVVAAVVLTGPTFRLADRVKTMASEVAKTAREVEALWPMNISFRVSVPEVPEGEFDESSRGMEDRS